MELERTAQACAEIFAAALRQGRALSRQDVLARGLLTAHEADRALKALRAAGRIRRSAPSSGAEPRAVRYELADGSPAAPQRPAVVPATSRKVSFDALLAAWRIRVLDATTQECGRVAHVNEAFAQEERRELAALAQEGKRASRRRTG